jgi:glycosyltransferase involved in cell wall biosynthesis
MRSASHVSIVTPFYNTREYLAASIESVLRQTYQDWDYTLIDNQSTDGSSEIAARYAALYPGKVRVVRTASFLSQVQNYNFALTCIAPDSKYCKMVQADDWIFPQCLESMVEVADAHPKVGIVGAYELETDHVALDELAYPSTEVSGREIGRLYFLKRSYLFGTPTSLLMRSDLVRSRTPFYEERYSPFEDAHACFDLLTKVNFGFVHQVLTFSRRDNESIISRILPFGFLRFSRYSMVVTHGRDFLSEQEYQEVLDDAARRYFLFLGKAALRGKNSDFWAFHRAGLASIGQNLDAKLLWKWRALALLDYLGNPKSGWDRFRRRRRLRAGNVDLALDEET